MGQPASRDRAEKGKINHGGSKSAPQQLAQKQRGLWKGRFGEQELLSPPPPLFCSPKYCKVVPGEGMPLPQEPRRRGDLLISFNICFPRELTPEKKMLLKSALLS